jgi:hypothetical protein
VDPSHRHTVNISGGSLSYNYQVDQNTIHVSFTVQGSKLVHLCRDVSFLGLENKSADRRATTDISKKAKKKVTTKRKKW